MSIHPQIKKVLEIAGEINISTKNLDPKTERLKHIQTRSKFDYHLEEIRSIKDITIALPVHKVRIRIYKNDMSTNRPLVMVFHGGGWVVGDLDSEDTTCRSIATRTGGVVISVEYRLSPETGFPGGLEDCYNVMLWAIENCQYLGINPNLIATVGTSAGGNLSGAICILSSKKKHPKISHQALMCPVIDNNFERKSYKLYGTGEYGLSMQKMKWFFKQYLGHNQNNKNPLVSLLQNEDFGNLPSATLVVAEYDCLKDEALEYSTKLSSNGINVSCKIYNGMNHGFNVRLGHVDAAESAIDHISDRINESFYNNRKF